jgi:hypothetical protein
VAKDRLISMTDPNARHGRKSQGRTFNGFKVHGLGDAVSGLIVSLTVTPGNAHDGSVCHRLIKRAKALVMDIKEVLADSAYGGAALRMEVRLGLGVNLLAPALGIPEMESNRLSRQAFSIDFQARSATCPAGVVTTVASWVRSTEHDASCLKFSWPRESCNACPLKASCTDTTRAGRSLKLHPYEEELRRSREDWEKPEVREKYRRRTECERLMQLMVRQGRRQTRSFGLKMAHQQAHLIVAVNNLQVLAKRLALQEEARESLAA